MSLKGFYTWVLLAESGNNPPQLLGTAEIWASRLRHKSRSTPNSRLVFSKGV